MACADTPLGTPKFIAQELSGRSRKLHFSHFSWKKEMNNSQHFTNHWHPNRSLLK